MRSGGKACWKTILLEVPRIAGAAEISRTERLCALYRFQSGQAAPEVRLVDPSRQAVLTDPAEIDWSEFPMLDALEAVTRDELRRLCALLRADTTPDKPAPPSNRFPWNADARREAPAPDA